VRVNIILMALFLQLCSACLYHVAAQTPTRKKFYVGLEMGAGFLRHSQNYLPVEQQTCYVLGFYGGYSPFHWLRTGINLNGWLLEPFGDFNSPEKGISISNTSIQLQLFPIKKVNGFVNLQGGTAQYTNHHPDQYNAKGTGLKIGIGYEYDLAKRTGLTLIVNYAWGRFNDVRYPPDILVTHQQYSAVDIVLGIVYH
jgi:hypothetical protein